MFPLYSNLDTSNPPVAGRLAYFIQNWSLITNDPWVTQTVTGYHIEFTQNPVQLVLPPLLPFSEEETLAMDNEIKSLQDKGAIHQASLSDPGFVSSLFMVPKKGGGQRPVINLKALNNFVEYSHFKMEGIHMLRDLLRKDDFMVTLDLKDAYFTVPVWINHQKYLRFLWKGTMWEFACLPFGLASAPRVFSKIMKPVIGMLRKMGVRLIVYLDDILIMAESKQLATQHAQLVASTLENLGFVVNYEKSVLTPSLQMEFLGFLVDSKTLTLALPHEKVRKIQRECQKALTVPSLTLRKLASLIGLLNSSIQAVFPAPLHYRHLQNLKNQQLCHSMNYESEVLLSPQAQEELSWWRDSLLAWNGKALVSGDPDLTIETDASLLGWGAVCNGVRTGGLWTQSERLLHINCLELMGGAFAVKAFTQHKTQVRVLLLMDNVTAVTYINKMGGTRSPILSSLAFELWTWCLQRRTSLTARHIPGIQNIQADQESRTVVDHSDWKLKPEIFQCIQSLWGPLEIDLFASRLSYQIPRYASWRPDPGAEAVDAFTLDWAQLVGYAFPPFALVGRCLKQVILQKVQKLVIVAPVWETQPWYPLLLQLCVDFPRLLPQPVDLLTRQGENHPLTHLQLAGWLISTGHTQRQVFLQKLEHCSWPHGGKTPQVPIVQLGKSGLAGVINNRLIPFQPL